MRYLSAHTSNVDAVHLSRAGINNVKTGYKERAHTLLPVSWKKSLNKKGADFPQLGDAFPWKYYWEWKWLYNRCKGTSICWTKDMEWWRKSRQKLVAAQRIRDILTSQGSFLLTVLTSCGLREECLCVLITHAGEAKQEAWEAWETPERLKNKPCRVDTAHLIWGRIWERWVVSSRSGLHRVMQSRNHWVQSKMLFTLNRTYAYVWILHQASLYLSPSLLPSTKQNWLCCHAEVTNRLSPLQKKQMNNIDFAGQNLPLRLRLTGQILEDAY